MNRKLAAGMRGLLVLLGIALPVAAAAQSAGRAEIGAESFDDSLPGLSARGIYANTSLFLSTGGVLEGTFNILQDGRHQIVSGRNAVALREVPWGDARFSASVGDLNEALDRASVRLGNDFSPRPLFRGISLLRDSASLTVSLFGGRNEQLIGSRLPAVQFAPESFVGGSAAWRPVKNVTLDFATLQVRNDHSGDKSLFGIPLSNRAETYSAGLTAAPGKGIRLQGRLTYSKALYSGADLPPDRSFLSFLAGGIYESKHWRLEGNYTRSGVDLVPLSTIYAGNREGPYIAAAYTDSRLSASGSAQRYRSNPDGIPEVADLRSASYQFGGNVRVGNLNSVGVTYSDQQLESSTSGALSSYRLRSAALQASVTTYGSTFLRYEHDDNISPEGVRRVHQVEAQHFLALGPFHLVAGLRLQRDDRGATSTIYEGGIDGTFGPVRLFANGQWGDDLSGGSIFTQNRNRTITYGAAVQLPAEFQLQVEGYRNKTDSMLSAESAFVNPGLTISSFSRSTFLVRLTRVLRWGSGDRQRPIGVSAELLPYGTLAGPVFADLNGNGVLDPGERPVAGIIVSLDGGQLARSGPDGRYAFRNVIEGDHNIGIAVEDLPVAYNPPARPFATARVERLKPGEHDFALILVGGLSGRVEQVLASGERVGFSGAIVTLLPAEFSTYTDEEGSFSFANLPPGHYSVRLETESLPDGASAENPMREDVPLTAGETRTLDPFSFTLKIEEKPVREILQKDQGVISKPKPKKPRPVESAASNRRRVRST
jgi:hypothetical protein